MKVSIVQSRVWYLLPLIGIIIGASLGSCGGQEAPPAEPAMIDQPITKPVSQFTKRLDSSKTPAIKESLEVVPELIEPLAPKVANKATWSPTYRAARNVGIEPVLAQYLSDMCKAGLAIGEDRLCLDPKKPVEETRFKIRTIAVAARIYMETQEAKGVNINGVKRGI